MSQENCNIESLIQFGRNNGKHWDAISNATELTKTDKATIQSVIQADGLDYLSEDNDLVVFGSIARGEVTSGSDVDWTLLVDGQVNSSRNFQMASLIQNGLKNKKLKDPGPNGPFGNITFSHDLVHYIGGQDDTNHNLTQRSLLLLESAIISGNDNPRTGTAYDRVLMAIIEQYIDNDSGYRVNNPNPHFAPRFLLNDVVRYWRTICVDFAYKQIEQEGNKWAIRNFKLRLSRRLIFLKGFLICFYCYLNKLTKEPAKQKLFELVKLNPLGLVFCILSDPKLNIKQEYILNLFDAYNQFLTKLNDSEFRKSLENLKIENAYENSMFLKSREISSQFHSALSAILFEQDNDLKEFIHKYGIF